MSPVIRPPNKFRVWSILFCLLVMAMILSCDDHSDHTIDGSMEKIGKIDVYLFSPGAEQVLSSAQPLELEFPSDLLMKEALNLLGKRLAETYFSKIPTGNGTGIKFDVLSVHTIKTTARSVRIAVVNMIDKNQDAMKYFFQGSFGGQTTFYMIAATFFQPQNDPPLLDGLILQYNGKTFPRLDHINFQGIVTPRSVKPVVYRAIELSKT